MKIIRWKTVKEFLGDFPSLEDFLIRDNVTLPVELMVNLSQPYRQIDGKNYSRTPEDENKKADYFNQKMEELLDILVDTDEIPELVEMSIFAIAYPKYYSQITPKGFIPWIFGDYVYFTFDSKDESLSIEEMLLLIKEFADKERRKWENLKRLYSESSLAIEENGRERISEEVRIAVWRRDDGKCVRCGSREKLEYDHIVPISRGGSNTVRNIELLCEKCNREKSNNIQ